MKNFFVIRHAKSSWKDENLEDFDRPLNKRGEIDAPLMAKHLKKRGIKPDLILCSPALRTKTTAQIIAKELDCIKLIQYDKELYEADEKTIFAKLIEINENLMTVFIIGHNPGLNDFLSTIVGFDENFPTCADNFAKL
jgi:phosphohistidine phosphatase